MKDKVATTSVSNSEWAWLWKGIEKWWVDKEKCGFFNVADNKAGSCADGKDEAEWGRQNGEARGRCMGSPADTCGDWPPIGRGMYLTGV